MKSVLGGGMVLINRPDSVSRVLCTAHSTKRHYRFNGLSSMESALSLSILHGKIVSIFTGQRILPVFLSTFLAPPNHGLGRHRGLIAI